jgi:DNA-binding beta-propeller fold protein YncE
MKLLRKAGPVLGGMCAAVLVLPLSACHGGTGAAPAAVGTATTAPATATSAAATPVIATTVRAKTEHIRPHRMRIAGRVLAHPDAIAVAGNRVWVANSAYREGGRGWLTEIDATTGALIRVIAGPQYGLVDPEALAVDGDTLWVADGYGNAVTEIDASTGALIRVIAGWQYQLDDAGAIATGGGAVWVANGFSDTVTEIDASTGALIRVISAPRYRLNTTVYAPAIAVAAGRVWVPDGSSNTVTEIDASTGALVRVIPSLPNVPFAIAAEGDQAWLVVNLGEKAVDGTRPDGSVAELSTSGGLIRDISGSPFRADSPGGAIAAAGGYVWVTDTSFYSYRGWVAEISSSTGAVIRVIVD